MKSKAKEWRPRAALAGVVAVCMTATVLAVSGAGADTAGMKFVQTGHLIYNSTLGTVFHVDGATKNVDGQVSVPGLAPGTQAVQTDTKGFVLARGSITEFGKSDLKVEDPRPAPSDEKPVLLEAAGAAFAIYRQAGAISRMNDNPVTLSIGPGLGQPVATKSGTLWVHRTTAGQICQLPVQADRLSCGAQLTSGHGGALTVVGDQVMFVDTTARELRTVGADGFGPPVPINGVSVTPDSIIAPYDVNGRIAILDPGKNELNLVDPAPVRGDRKPADPVVRKVPQGKYSQIASSGKGVAMIDSSTDTLVTIDSNGKTTPHKIKPPSAGARVPKDQKPDLFRGADSRLYVDSTAGERVMVVDDDGEVTEVETGKESKKPGKESTPESKPTTPPPSTPPPNPPSTQPTRSEPTRTNQPARTNGPDENENKPKRPPRTEPPRTMEPPEATKPTSKPPTTKPTPIKASRAGAPPGLKASETDGAVTLSWRRPNLNGGKLVRYSISQGGDSVSATSPKYTWSGLTNETSYTFRVRAITRGTDGKLLTGVPSTVTATPKGNGRVWITYDGPVSKYGDEYTDSNCPEDTDAEDCGYIMVHASGLEPNTSYHFRAYASEWGELHTENGGGYDIETDDDGNIQQKKFHNSAVGQRIYVTATGPGGPYRSASITWPNG
ncbi:fibronectin type III domain-containing protein [Kribbella antiqua]|uniref:fibronectin type III domain-containing protein n=1 Tax=Kribbella antiqua TaxID=2512217 RepID=UPI001044820F|nr:fibronectin type III domain-containing protein [Kribbella antiqua]